MARIRSIKPEFWTDEKLAEVPREVRLTFIGLISACADDVGRFKANARLVKAAIYPLDDGITAAAVEAELAELEALGVVELYTVSGERYGRIVNWLRHQKIDKATKSRLPEPPGAGPSSFRPSFDDSSSNIRRTLATEAEAERSEEVDLGSGAERKGGSDRGATPTAAAVPDTAGTLTRWLARFYGDATPARREQVREQLAALHRGQEVRFRKSTVRAKDPSHLARKAGEMLDVGFMIDDPAKAIVILLMKLQDPEKDAQGRFPSEAAADVDRANQRELDAYYAARERAVKVWMNAGANRDDLVTLEKRVRAALTIAPGEFGYKMALAGQLAQAVADHIGFPEFDTWRGKQRQAS